VTLEIEIRQLDVHSRFLSEAAALHIACLPRTLTSKRGCKTTQGLYRYLIQHGHIIHLAMKEDRVVGGLVVIRHSCQKSNLFLTMYRPWSWFSTLRIFDIRNTFQQLLDLYSIQRASRQLIPHDYIAALYVADSARRLGIASLLVECAIADTKVRSVGLAVDTALSNESAKSLYKSLSFVESHRTKISAQFTLGLG
jgi:GNAT superfamily N-acetyltransferase